MSSKLYLKKVAKMFKISSFFVFKVTRFFANQAEPSFFCKIWRAEPSRAFWKAWRAEPRQAFLPKSLSQNRAKPSRASFWTQHYYLPWIGIDHNMGFFWSFLALPPQNLCWVNFNTNFPENPLSGLSIIVTLTTGKPIFRIQEFIRVPTSIPEESLINFHRSSVSEKFKDDLSCRFVDTFS